MFRVRNLRRRRAFVGDLDTFNNTNLVPGTRCLTLISPPQWFVRGMAPVYQSDSLVRDETAQQTQVCNLPM